MTAVPGDSCRTARSTSMPVPSGMRMSVTTRSNSLPSRLRTAARTPLAISTRQPWRRKLARSAVRMPGSSSTISTELAVSLLIRWKLQFKSGSMVQQAGNAYLSVMLMHQAFADGQAKTRRIALSAEPRIEKLAQHVLWNSAAGVRHPDQGPHPARPRDSHGCHSDLIARRCVADCVANEIQNDLAEAVVVTLNRQPLDSGEKRERDSRLLRDGLHKLDTAPDAGDKVQWRETRNSFAVKAQDVIYGPRKQPDPGAKIRHPLCRLLGIVGNQASK